MWSAAGDKIIIPNVLEFTNHVLIRYFKHKTFQSFIRQMNMYSFQKSSSARNNSRQFFHRDFHRDFPHKRMLIKRKSVRNKKPKVQERTTRMKAVATLSEEVKHALERHRVRWRMNKQRRPRLTLSSP